MRIFPLGESALTVELGKTISLELNSKAIALARAIEAQPFEGLIEVSAAYASVTVFYDVVAVRRGLREVTTAFEGVRTLVMDALKTVEKGSIHLAISDQPPIEIPVRFDAAAAIDLEDICRFSGLDQEAVIEIFLSRVYRVYMLGFLPGFAYMGEVDERIAMPRLDSPRINVPRGSVGIAGRQTGIYPLDSPGGWRIIGLTDVRLFDAGATDPCLLKAGDSVKFVPEK